MQIFNAKTQQLEDVEWSVDANGELVCTFKDGHFYKLPAGTTKEQVVEWADIHHKANEGKVVITPEMEAQREAELAAANELVNELNGVPNAAQAQSDSAK